MLKVSRDLGASFMAAGQLTIFQKDSAGEMQEATFALVELDNNARSEASRARFREVVAARAADQEGTTTVRIFCDLPIPYMNKSGDALEYAKRQAQSAIVHAVHEIEPGCSVNFDTAASNEMDLEYNTLIALKLFLVILPLQESRGRCRCIAYRERGPRVSEPADDDG